ncbi:hypothetical protein ACFP1Z_00230 [Streptomyces gamaensis]|uniref:NACHT domain-containing protein n=1 Tax=Streptomyces gamaensis TaxID=1763542 RepID=A0ABW0YTL5_9ACTN
MLTSLHVVVDEHRRPHRYITVRVGHPRSGSDMVERDAELCWPDPRDDPPRPDAADVALLWLGKEVRTPAEPVAWGHPCGIDELPYHGAAFPLFAERAGEPGFEYLRGTLPPLATSGGSRYWVLNTAFPPGERQDARRPWGGASGAAVFCNDLLVGVVVEDDRETEWRRLHAEPVHTLFRDDAFIDLVTRHGNAGQIPLVHEIRAGRRIPRSSYTREIAHWAAAEDFVGREQELADMTDFVLAGDGDEVPPAYWRWVAPAWSGKTSLMAHFVLDHLPAMGARVDVLAFFIARRHAGQSDRTAFLAAMQRQLREYLHDPDVDCGALGPFHEALERAGRQARDAERRIVLVVDGLDEDSGMATAVEGNSIAALLPHGPMPGVRIIVTCRPHPPVPADVPYGHPLRDPGISRSLAASEAAQAARLEAERDLVELIRRGGIAQELTGLIAAASGGLTAVDLAALMETACSVREVELVLEGSLGRSFQRLEAEWSRGEHGPAWLYSFAHGELLVTAGNLLAHEMEGYRDRLHDWVLDYWQRRWPDDTPEWILVGCPQVLWQQGDAVLLSTLAADRERHEQLWRKTGSDAGALAEIEKAFELQRQLPDPDVPACLRLARRREALERNLENTPTDLIITWARLGQVRRAVNFIRERREGWRDWLLASVYRVARRWPDAEELVIIAARSLSDPVERALALAMLAEELAQAGRHELAADLARDAVDLAQRPDTGRGGETARSVAVRVFLRIGRDDQALVCARNIATPVRRGLALVRVAASLARAGQRVKAAELVEEAAGLAVTAAAQPHPALHDGYRAREDATLVLDEAAQVLAEIGRIGQASALAAAEPREDENRILASIATVLAKASRHEEVAALTCSMTDPYWRCKALTRAAEQCLAADGIGRAAEYAAEAAIVIDDIADSVKKHWALPGVASLLIKIGQHEQAVALAHTATVPNREAEALADVAKLLAEHKQRELAAQVRGAAVLAARAIDDQTPKDNALAHAAESVARAGECVQASAIANEIADSFKRASTLVEVAAALADAGEYDPAAALARSITDSRKRAEALVRVARVMAETGLLEEAEALAHEVAVTVRTMADQHDKDQLLAEVALAVADVGRHGQAARLTRAITAPYTRGETLAKVSSALARAGNHQLATSLAQEIAEKRTRAESLACVVSALAASGQHKQAAALARSITDGYVRSTATAKVASALAQAGDHEAAVALARTIECGDSRAEALAKLARLLIQRGQPEEAWSLAQELAASARAFFASNQPFFSLTDIALAYDESGHCSEAAVLLGEAVDIFSCRSRGGFEQDYAQAHLARMLAKTRQTERASSLADTIGRAGLRARALTDVAAVMVEMGSLSHAATLLAAAEDAARKLPDAQQMGWTLFDMAENLIRVGWYEKAAELTRIIPRTGQRCGEESARFMRVVVRVLSEAGQYQMAVSLAQEIPIHDMRVWVLMDVAQSLANAARGEEAALVVAKTVRLALSLTPSPDDGAILSGLSHALATAGRHEQAAALARSIESPYWKSQALADVAESMGPCAAGRHLLAEALDTGRFSNGLTAATLTLVPGCADNLLGMATSPP